jgi:hypothetical protein
LAEASHPTIDCIESGLPGNLINLGSVLGGQGRWAEAKATYSGVAFNALGRLLSRLTEDDEEAERCLRQATALKACDNNTYVELDNILMRKLQTDAARSAALMTYSHSSPSVPIRTKLTFRRCSLIRRLPARHGSLIWLTEPPTIVISTA